MERIHSLSMEEQEDLRIVEHLETEYATLISLLGDNFHSSVIRMAVQIERIAMVLTAMRGEGEQSVFSRQYSDELKPACDAGLTDEESRNTIP